MNITEIQTLLEDFMHEDNVEAVVLGGSRASGLNDDKSDYDLYVYTTPALSLEKRQEIMKKHCTIMEIGNHYWEDEDNCVLKTGTCIDIIYRSLEEFSNVMHYVVDDCNSFNGYTTCFWHNLITSEILFDRNGNFKTLQNQYNIPYPKKLKENIITQNMNLLTGVLPSYDLQIQKAINRKDAVSVNHRVSGFLASYFDIIFALNEKTHPGEKRLVKLCCEQCSILPNNFEENIDRLFKSMYNASETMSVIKDMICALQKLL